jgi:hypothetical protein
MLTKIACFLVSEFIFDDASVTSMSNVCVVAGFKKICEVDVPLIA